MFKKKAEGGAFQDGKVGEMEVTKHSRPFGSLITLIPDEGWDDCRNFRSTWPSPFPKRPFSSLPKI